MSTKKEVIEDWFALGVKKKAIFLLVVCDTFDWEDFPVFSHSVEEAQEKYRRYAAGENMTRLMEVYDLRKDMQTQLNKVRNFAKIE